MSHALYPGTFDPVHRGHLDVVERASRIFDRVTVAVLENPSKNPVFSAQERVDFLQEALSELQNVSVMRFDGLTVECAKNQGASVILRGLRAVLDFDYEVQTAMMNRHLEPSVETFFLLTKSRYAYISSSLVKQLAKFDAPLDDFVPPSVAKALKRLSSPKA
ncbi:MAG: pantetheine-phosphate adenylyltransferase [Thermaerobacter sp.]|nr:pantetheine-phosphate adenylyltransferase [Thermaerobacter sp.]